MLISLFVSLFVSPFAALQEGQPIDPLVDCSLIAAARCIPQWSAKDLPALPSKEEAAALAIAKACVEELERYPTSLEEDMKLLSMHIMLGFLLFGFCLLNLTCCAGLVLFRFVSFSGNLEGSNESVRYVAAIK